MLAHTTTLLEVSAPEQRRLARLAGDANPLALSSDEVPQEEHASRILAWVRLERRLPELAEDVLDGTQPGS